MNTPILPLRERMIAYVHELQNRICAAIEEIDGTGRFRSDAWERPGGGGGDTRVISKGTVFEKGGVNTSVVHGALPATMAERMKVPSAEFLATGVSLVLHPHSPRIPTVHANFRYFEMETGDRWFGGGADLTPYIADPWDGGHFHTTIKRACDPFGTELYPRFKQECDRYFSIKHRGEARGLGGIFYDYLRPTSNDHAEQLFDFTRSVGDAFLPAYLPIVERHRNEPHTEREKHFQMLRRGRYVEFNLVYDRGTLFGLETNGRTESILMSLPPEVRFEYDAPMETTDSERVLMGWLRQPREWAGTEVEQPSR